MTWRASGHTVMRAGRLLCRWLEDHLECFRLRAAPQEQPLEQLKRLSEFSLVLLGLTRERRSVPNVGYCDWAHTVARALASDLQAAHGDLGSYVRAQSSAAARATLLAFPALESVTRSRFDNHALVLDLLRADEGGQRTCDLELAFARDVAGLADCRGRMTAELSKIIQASPGGPAAEHRQQTYDLTHIAFYATRMGRRRAGWDQNDASWLRERLESSAASCVRAGDLDLAGESATSLLMAGFARCRPVDRVAESLSAAARAEGRIPVHPRVPGRNADEFTDHYHATLVGLSTLAEFELSCPGLGGRRLTL